MSIIVTARKWEHGWELWIDGEAATQVRTLDKAEQQVRDYLDTIDPATDHSATDITIRPDLGGIEHDVEAARERSEHAAREQREAAAALREATRKLRSSGLSVADTAAVLGVSRGRVSQLTAERDRSAA